VSKFVAYPQRRGHSRGPLLSAPVYNQNRDSSNDRQGSEQRREVDFMMFFLVDLERTDVHLLLSVVYVKPG
jgi:hypothetical protein